MAMFVLVNTLSITLEHTRDSAFGQVWSSDSRYFLFHAILEMVDLALSLCFCVELMVKVVSFGPVTYFTQLPNIFDVVVISLSMSLFADTLQDCQCKLYFNGPTYIGACPSVSKYSMLRVFRLVRIIKIFRAFPSITEQMNIILGMLPGVAAAYLLLAIAVIVFSILGTALFGGLLMDAVGVDDFYITPGSRIYAEMQGSSSSNFSLTKRLGIIGAQNRMLTNGSWHVNWQVQYVSGFSPGFRVLGSGIVTLPSQDNLTLPRILGYSPRTSFDTLLQGIVCVFHIIGSGGWLLMAGMVNAMGWSSAAYFYSLILVGRLLVCNLIIAVIIHKYNEHVASRQSTITPAQRMPHLVPPRVLRRKSSIELALMSVWNLLFRRTDKIAQQQRLKQAALDQLLPQGKLRAKELGRSIWVRKSDILAWIYEEDLQREQAEAAVKKKKLIKNLRALPVVGGREQGQFVEGIVVGYEEPREDLSLPPSYGANQKGTYRVFFRAANGIPRDFEKSWNPAELNQILKGQEDIDFLQKELVIQRSLDPAVLGKRLAANLEEAIKLLNAQLENIKNEEARLRGWKELQEEVLKSKSTFTTGRVMHLLERERPNVAEPLRLTTPTVSNISAGIGTAVGPALSTELTMKGEKALTGRQAPGEVHAAARRIISRKEEAVEMGKFRKLDMNDVHQLHDPEHTANKDFSYYAIESHRLQEKISSLRRRQAELTEGVLTGLSCCVFKPLDPTRRRAAAIMVSPIFGGMMNLTIVASCICLLVDRPFLPAQQSSSLMKANLAFNFCFVVEAVIKMVALGERGYLRDAWNRLDLFIVTISLVDTILTFFEVGNAAALGAFKTMRVFRAVRPLRIIFKSGSGGLQIISSAVTMSLHRILLVFGLTWTALTIFAIIGMQLLGGNLGACSDVDVAYRLNCVGPDPFLSSEEGVGIPRQWSVRPRNFDWIGAAFVSVVSLATHDDLPGLYFDAVDSAGDDNTGPYENSRQWLAIYFIPLIVICSLFFINLFIGVMADAYQNAANEHAKTVAASEDSAAARRKRTLKREDLPMMLDASSDESAGGLELTIRALRRNFRSPVDVHRAVQCGEN